MSLRSGVRVCAVAVAIGAGSIGCGGDGNGSDGSSATIGGNVTSAPSASVEQSGRSLLAILAEDVLGFARAAYAQVADLAGIEVSGGGASDTTDENGSFDLTGVTAGDVEITLRRGDCEAVLPVTDVSEGATILLEDIDFQCTTAEAARVSETLEGVVRAARRARTETSRSAWSSTARRRRGRSASRMRRSTAARSKAWFPASSCR